ncbi:MAG: hypothetical protein OXR66_06795 [Candidatus Woesearchaeota archaeon]|nr:hypothetical protein [Candidatus Woesearchaeota archaeon]
MRRANAVATVLIIAALLVTATVVTQRTVFTSESSSMQQTLNAFGRNVYESPDEMIERYAKNGYQAGVESLWYCGQHASPPTLQQTKDQFAAFAQADLEGRIADLTAAYPEYNIQISSPLFTLTAPDQPDQLVEEVVSVDVRDLTITVQDGDRFIETGFDQQQDYPYRFWYLYNKFTDWITCNNGGIYGVIEQTLESKSCAFFKDQCFCAKHEWSFCDGSTSDCNGCPCGRQGAGLPLYTEEDCSADDPKKCQDFTQSERQQLKDTYGVSKNDLQQIGNGIAQELTNMFAGNPVCGNTEPSAPTGITCTARIEEPKIENFFGSSYSYHPTGCIEQVDGSCGIVPINAFDLLLCSGAPLCPPNSVLDTPNGVADAIAAVTTGTATRCREVTKTNEDDSTYQVVECDKHVIGPAGTPPLADCSWNELQFNSRAGAAGSDPDAPPLGITCNALPLNADPGPGDRASQVTKAGDPLVKEIRTDSEFAKRGNDPFYYWFGMNGWLDRRGSFDLTITCSDPGAPGIRPLQAGMQLHVAFKHGCDTDQARGLGWAPSACAAPGTVSSPRTCDLDCHHPCLNQRCEFVDGDPAKGMECVEQPGERPTTCDDPNNVCIQGTCVTPPGGGDPYCDGTINPTPTNDGAACGPEGTRDFICYGCQNGACLPREIECSIFSPLCHTNMCVVSGSTSTCTLVQGDPGAPCGGSGCGVCTCSDTCGTGGTCLPEWEPDQNACGGETYYTTCRDQVTIDHICVNKGMAGYECEVPSDAPTRKEASDCCPGFGPTSQDCSLSGEVCCPAGFCDAQDKCGTV